MRIGTNVCRAGLKRGLHGTKPAAAKFQGREERLDHRKTDKRRTLLRIKILEPALTISRINLFRYLTNLFIHFVQYNILYYNFNKAYYKSKVVLCIFSKYFATI